MDPRLQGSLGESLVPDLIREIARRGASGTLRLCRDNAARSIYFDSGTPVSLTSELADEQLESQLLKEGRTTAGLIHAARRSQPKSSLSRALVDKGVLSEEVLSLTTGELVRQIVLSIFEWEEGEYEFDEGARPAEAAALQCTPGDLIKGARHAAGIERLAKAIAPPDLLIAPADTNNYFLASLPALDSVESYVLSRIELPVRVSEVADLVGLPEEDTHRAVCVLVALGLLARAGFAASEAAGRQGVSPDPLLAAVSRKLQLLESADYYEVLGVDMFATAAGVTRAFDELQRMFDSYRALSDNKELHIKLDALFLKVKEAYQTLSDPTRRWAYDKTKASTDSPAWKAPLNEGTHLRMRSDGRDSSKRLSIPFAPTSGVLHFDSESGEPQAHTQAPGLRTSTTPIESSTRSESSHVPKRVPIPGLASGPIELQAQPITAELRQPKRAPIPGLGSSPIETPAAPPGIKPAEQEPGRAEPPQWLTASQTALRNYNQGRTRYEQKDVNAAHHLFREACRLDASQPHYHFYLAMTLIILSQARREHAHHEGCHVTCSLGGALVSNPRMRYEAEQHLLKAAELDPVNPQIPLRLGLLFKEAGLIKKAEHYFHETLLRDGKNKTALFELEALRDDDTQTTDDAVDLETDE